MSLLFNIIGVLGVISFFIDFVLLQLEVLTVRDYLYQWLNVLGGGLLVISLLYHWNIAAIISNSMWTTVSIACIIRIYIQKRREKNVKSFIRSPN